MAVPSFEANAPCTPSRQQCAKVVQGAVVAVSASYEMISVLLLTLV